MNKVYVGIDLGGTSVKIGVCETNGKVIGEVEQPTPKGAYQEALKTFKRLLSDLLLQNGLSMRQVAGVGIGAPALLDIKKGFAYEVVNLGWKDAPLKDECERIFGVPCYVDNDANAAAMGELWQGAGKGSSEMICVTVGTGIGCGLIINGDIYHGSIGLAGEIGHLKARPGDGRRCNCGEIGCLETEASASAIVYYGLEAARSGVATTLARIVEKSGSLTAKNVIDAAKAGDKVSLNIMKDVSHYLGLALAHLSNALNPEKIIIGGGVSRAGAFFINPIRDQFHVYALKKIAETAEILPAELGNSAGWIGAAWLVHRNHGQDGGK